jgi:hypothetical protein
MVQIPETGWQAWWRRIQNFETWRSILSTWIPQDLWGWVVMAIPPFVAGLASWLAGLKPFTLSIWVLLLIPVGLFAANQLSEWRNRGSRTATLPDASETKLIPMKDAATRLFSESRVAGTPLANSAEQLSPGDVINWVAVNISMRIPAVWGKRHPSVLFERIAKEEVRRLNFKAEGTELWRNFGNSAEFIDVQVRKADLERVIAELVTDREEV